MTPPAWLAARLSADERVLWVQPPPPGAIWGVIGPAVGAAFALYFGGAWVYDMPGRWEWLTGDMDERLGLPTWLVMLTGGAGFVSLVTKDAATSMLSTWVLTDRRLIRAMPRAPWMSKEWPRGQISLKRVKLKKKGASVKLQVPTRFGHDTFSIDAREPAAALVDGLRPAGASFPGP